MKFPFILRSDHEEQVRLLNVIICTLEDQNKTKTEQLTRKEMEIQALINELALPDLAEEALTNSRNKRDKSKPHVITGRGGFRARAQQASRATIKAAPDSAKQLEEKVKREGGNV